MNDALSRLAAGGLNEPLMQGLKDHFLTAEAANLQSNIGHFIMWFGTAEMFLTRLLAHLVGMHDMEKFDLLCKGMDARIKCERFKKAAKQAGGLGKKFSDELSYFEKKSIPLRNRISHSWPVQHEETIYFCTVKSGAFSPTDFKKDGTEISTLALFAEGFWLNGFAKNIHLAMVSVFSEGPIEIVDDIPNPQSEGHL